MKALVLTLAFVVSSLSACSCEGTPSDGPGPDDPVATGRNVVVTDARVRACDAVFAVSGEEVPSVVFAADVVGEAIPRAPRLAISFVTPTGVKDAEVARFAFTRSGNSPPTLVTARCFDAAGASVDGALSLVD